MTESARAPQPDASAWTPLGSADFRKFWVGLVVSMVGSNLRAAALLWHVTLLVPSSQKAMALGGVGLVRAIAILGCALLAGAVADAVDRRRLLIWINCLMLLVSAALAVAAFTHRVSLGGLYVAAALFSAGGTFDNPARNAYYPMLLPGSLLPKAIVLVGGAYQVTAVVGPALAGVLIGESGVALVYALDAASFFIIIGALLASRTGALPPPEQRGQISVAAIASGLRFVFGHTLIRTSMLLDFVATFFASATALLPIYAQDVLHAGARGYGVLSSAMAAGSVFVSVVFGARIERFAARGKLLTVAVVLYGAATAAFACSRWFWLSAVLLACIGAFDMVSTVLRQLIRQLETPNALRGRMAGVNLIFFMGGPQLGELEAGLVAQAFGAPLSVLSGGIACMLAGAAFAVKVPQLWGYRRTQG